ncbi:Transposable element Tcb1 transposase [Araneus ventricosus]|uniref:Transposable element Tcb1 transposase n=1 Tax=Araneus ventricosus TaxID=182803 RepID=A0A4Y2CRX1_ARAVE|nr:Transposable element Tcb1 transposase [Araneus ventricosus]
MSRRNHLYDEMRCRAVGMLQAGARQSSVARELNVHRRNHYQRDQNASRRRGSGRRRITTTPDDRYLLQCARRPTTLTARQLASQLSAAAGRPISRQTVSRRLHEGGLFARRPAVRLPPAHVRARLHWSREHRSWTPEQWGHVLFTDESRFNIQNDSQRTMIWREPGTRYRAPNIVERDHYRSGGLLVWAGIAMNGRTDLYVFAGGSITAVRYRHEMPHPLVRSFIAAMGTDAIFMDNNACPHRARLVGSYLESETIPQMAWPARSPDLNPIEHVWNMLGRRIAGRRVQPGTLHELQQALLQEWALLPQQAINDTIASMPRRCQACISARRYHTRFFSVWFPLHILLINLGCRAATAVIYVFLFVFALLFDMWSSNATPTSCTTFTDIH